MSDFSLLAADARPFRLICFQTPGDGIAQQLSLEIEAVGGSNGTVTLRNNVAGFDQAKGTSLSVFEVSPAFPPPGQERQAPVERAQARHLICTDSDEVWQRSFAGSSDLMLVVAPGDLDSETVDTF